MMDRGPIGGKTKSVREIFSAALACGDHGERGRLLDAECGEDADLRVVVEDLLREATQTGDFLERPAVVVAPEVLRRSERLPSGEQPGEMVGPYRLVELLGEGGGGSVYCAEQHEPVRRTVALKILKLGMDTRSVIARFETERQALAMMDHPNIAKVLDAGATEGGRPYFVMDRVPGEPITIHCDANELTVRARVALFVKVCRAVEHAHQKAIVHRDLKPSNILVAWQDGAEVPKIIDFGVAKALDVSNNAGTAVTLAETLIGTPAYMSPEQAERRSADIDTRSDIYSLGVLLYELLCGFTPIDKSDLERVGIDGMRRLLCESTLLRPSARLRSSPRSEVSPAALDRSTTIEKLAADLAGDLDWIVMKCLEREPARRFGSASELANDLERFLAGAPITARPPSAAYRLGKFVRRHRTAVVAGASVLVVLIAAAVLSTALAIRAIRAERVESKLRAEAVRERELALRSAATARLHEYVADIGISHQALANGNVGKALQRLTRHSQASPGQPDLRGFEWRYLAGRCAGDPHQSLPRRDGAVSAMAYCPNGDHLAIATRDEVFVWNLRDERPLGKLTGGASALAFFPEGERLAVASRDGVWVYELDPLQPVLEVQDRGAALAVSPDGHLLATSDRRGVTVRETENWSTIHRLPDAAGPLAFSPDGEKLATGSRDGITLWSLGGSGGSVVLEDSPVGTRDPFPGAGGVVFSPDGGVVVAPLRPGLAGGEFALGCWDARTGRERTSLPAEAGGDGHTGLISGLFMDRGGELLATGSWDHSVCLWDIGSGRLVRRLLGHRGEVWSVALSPDGAFVASGGKGGEVKVWPVWESGPPEAISGRWKPLRISRDGRYVVALDREGSLSILNLRSCEIVNSVELSAAETRFGRSAVSLSSDLAVLAEGRADGTVRVRRFDGGEESSLQVSEDAVDFVALSPGAEELVAGSRHDGLSWWNLADPGKPLMRLTGSHAVFSEDGGSLVVMGREGAVIVYDTASRNVRARIGNDGRGFGASVAISADGKLLALTRGFEDFENAVSLWDTMSGERLGTLTGHKQVIWSVAFSPDGSTLATSSSDGTVRLWNVASRRELLTLGEPGLSLDDLMFSPDGGVLVGGVPGFAAEGELRVFRAPQPLREEAEGRGENGDPGRK